MDFSKLPKLTNTKAQQAAQEAASADAPAPPENQTAGLPLPIANAASRSGPELVGYRSEGAQNAHPTGYGEAWISAIVAIICLMVSKSFPAYLISKFTGRPFHTGVNWTAGEMAGQEVAYPDLQGFTMINDAAIFLFGLTLLFDAMVVVVMNTNFRFRHALLWLAFAMSAIAVAFNAYVAAKLLSADTIPLISLLAIAFGGYIAATQWKLLQHAARYSAEEREPSLKR